MGVRTSLKNGTSVVGSHCVDVRSNKVAWYLCQTPPAQRALVMSLLYFSDKFLLFMLLIEAMPHTQVR